MLLLLPLQWKRKTSSYHYAGLIPTGAAQHRWPAAASPRDWLGAHLLPVCSFSFSGPNRNLGTEIYPFSEAPTGIKFVEFHLGQARKGSYGSFQKVTFEKTWWIRSISQEGLSKERWNPAESRLTAQRQLCLLSHTELFSAAWTEC